MSNVCFICDRRMIIKKGNLCQTCYDKLERSKKDNETSEMIAETLGDFCLFENAPPKPKFVRKFRRKLKRAE